MKNETREYKHPSPENPLTVVVRRSQWLRGETDKHSYLLREEDGRMCCLGFACLAMGVRFKDIMGARTPTELEIEGYEWPEKDSDVATARLMYTNDDDELRDPGREATIIAEGRKIGLNFVFED